MLICKTLECGECGDVIAGPMNSTDEYLACACGAIHIHEEGFEEFEVRQRLDADQIAQLQAEIGKDMSEATFWKTLKQMCVWM